MTSQQFYCRATGNYIELNTYVGHLFQSLLLLTLCNSAFEKGRKVWGGGLSAPVRKSIKELPGTPFCYLEFGTLQILRSHAKIQGLIQKTERDFDI